MAEVLSFIFEFFQDVGHAILESYSRILETLAFTVLSRIEDVMNADALARNPSSAEQKRHSKTERSPVTGSEKFPNNKEETENLSSNETPTSKTLLDFMGWNLDQGEMDGKKDFNDDVETKPLSKPENIITNKRISYIERLEILGGSRSPTARH